MNDLVSRQAAIDAILAVTGNSSVRELYEHVQEHGLAEMWSGGVNAAIDTIISVPSAQPERKKGKWYKPTGMMPPEYIGQYRCTVCDSLAMRDWKHHRQELTNFCPNCGADMWGEANAENVDEDQ